MRIVIDLQGAQSDSRHRGIGRYSLALALSVARNAGQHEVIVVLNGLLHESIESIRATFEGVLPQENIRVWHAAGPVQHNIPENTWRNKMAKLLRESFINQLQPDVILVTSVFEGYGDEAAVNIVNTANIPTAAVLYDLIPLMDPDLYLKSNPSYNAFYRENLSQLTQANRLLSISESAKNEGIQYLNKPSSEIVNISAAVDERFKPAQLTAEQKQKLRHKFGIKSEFIMYSGAADERKNHLRLIKAFALLPLSVRSELQLVLAGKLPHAYLVKFQTHAASCGLSTSDVIITDQISDDEMVALYSECKLYVFPSLHEGFGLPALEAMGCGAVVIGANTTSIPEVIANAEALFDPYDEKAIANKIQQVLEDETLQARLKKHASEQVKRFSWDITGQKAIAGMEQLLADSQRQPQLYVDVSELSQHDSQSGVQRVTRNILYELLTNSPQNYDVVPVYGNQEEWGYRHAAQYTHRFLQRTGQAPKDEWIRPRKGDIFLGLDLQHHVVIKQAPYFEYLKQAGIPCYFVIYDILPIQMPNYFVHGMDGLHRQWLSVLTQASGMIAGSKTVADEVYDWITAEKIELKHSYQLGWSHNGADIAEPNQRAKIPKTAAPVLQAIAARTSFLMVGTVEPRKGQKQSLEAFELLWKNGVDVNLVIAGKKGWNVNDLAKNITHHPEFNLRLFWLNDGINDAYLEAVYKACHCLIFASEGEGFGLPLIEAAQYGLPIVTRDIPVFREVAGDYAFYFTGKQAQDLASSVQQWLALSAQNAAPPSTAMAWSTWHESAQKLLSVVLDGDWYRQIPANTHTSCLPATELLFWQNSDFINKGCVNQDLLLTAKAIELNGVPERKQLLIDVSILVTHDAKTGIQRVVRNIARELLLNPPEGFTVKLVYATVEQGYRYAHQFVAEFDSGATKAQTVQEDYLVQAYAGDVFLGLDLALLVAKAQENYYQTLRNTGVQVYFVIYDLLPILKPEFFPKGTYEGFHDWLTAVAHKSDGLICISQSVENELETWLSESKIERERTVQTDWFHLGANVDADATNSPASATLSGTEKSILAKLQKKPAFLMVGTLEPRKGVAQTLAAFELLWQQGHDVSLVIVGKEGWNVEALIKKVKSHPELNKRLFWLEGVNDDYLDKIYASCVCLIAASVGEGFGLPLIEAAQQRIALLVRNLPVFEEVCGDHARYFEGDLPADLAAAVEQWLIDYRGNTAPQSNNMPWLTWADSSKELLKIISN